MVRPEQIIGKLCEAEVALSGDQTVSQILPATTPGYFGDSSLADRVAAETILAEYPDEEYSLIDVFLLS